MLYSLVCITYVFFPYYDLMFKESSLINIFISQENMSLKEQYLQRITEELQW